MRKIQVQKAEVAISGLRLKVPTDADYDLLIDEPSLVYEGDQLRAVFLDCDSDVDELFGVIRKIKYNTAGRTAGLVSTSRVVGFQPRITIRRNFCCAASLAFESPKDHAVICAWAQRAAALYQHYNPDMFTRHASTVTTAVKPEWLLPGGVFTSGIVNRDSSLRYHCDRGNFKGFWNCMYAYAYKMAGGHLVLPEYRVAFSFQKPRFITFDAPGTWHGVTALKKYTPQSWRYSVVYYSMQKMRSCLSAAEELTRIRTIKTRLEIKRAGLEDDNV